MRLVYFGTSAFAVPALERLAQHVVLVVTQPDRPSGRKLELRPSDVKKAALDLGLPVETPEKSRDPQFVERLRSLDADAFIVASYGQILSQAVLDVPRHGCFNLHASLLPQYRGAAPIQYALLHGEKVTGVTLMLMDKGMDTGDMVATVTTPIAPDETAGELHDRLAGLAGDLVAEWIDRLATGDFTRTPQPNDQATYAGKVTKADAELSFDRPAISEYDRYRAFTPFPGAWLATSAGTLKVKRARSCPEEPEARVVPGTLISTSPLRVAFSPGSLVLESVQLEGKGQVSGPDFANGARLKAGDCLKPLENRL